MQDVSHIMLMVFRHRYLNSCRLLHTTFIKHTWMKCNQLIDSFVWTSTYSLSWKKFIVSNQWMHTLILLARSLYVCSMCDSWNAYWKNWLMSCDQELHEHYFNYAIVEWYWILFARCCNLMIWPSPEFIVLHVSWFVTMILFIMMLRLRFIFMYEWLSWLWTYEIDKIFTLVFNCVLNFIVHQVLDLID
jgi:hypothetical protein